MNDSDNDPAEFTEDQLRAALKSVGEEARREAFSAGRSVMIAKEGAPFFSHPDGTEERVGPLCLEGNPISRE